MIVIIVNSLRYSHSRVYIIIAPSLKVKAGGYLTYLIVSHLDHLYKKQQHIFEHCSKTVSKIALPPSLSHPFPFLAHHHSCAGPWFAARLPWQRAAVHKPGNVWGTQRREAGNLVHSLSLTPWMVLLQSSVGSRSLRSKWKPYFSIRSIFHLLSQR